MGQSIDLPQLPTRRLRVHRADKSGSCHPSAGEPDAAPAVRSPRAPAGTRSTAAADQSRSRNRGLLANPVAGADADISDRADPGYRTPPRSRRHPHRPVRLATSLGFDFPVLPANPHSDDATVTLSVAAQLCRAGKEMILRSERDLCFRAGNGRTVHGLWRIVPLSRCRLTASRFNWFAAGFGAPSHCLPRGSGQGIVPAQNSTLEGGWV